MTWVCLHFYGSLKFMNAIFGLKEGSRRDRKGLGEGKGKKRGEKKKKNFLLLWLFACFDKVKSEKIKNRKVK